MKIAIMMLSYERFDKLSVTLPENMSRAGDVDLFVLDQGSKDPRIIPLLEKYAKHVFTVPKNVGVAAGFNFLLKHCYDRGYDLFQFMANDILEPEGWVSFKADHMRDIPNSGMVSIALEEHGYCSRPANGRWVAIGDVIGQFMISRAAYEKVGALREDFGPYGPVDIDYNYRCSRLGLINYYVPLMRAKHLDDRDNELYGYDKAQAVSRTWPEYVDSLPQYNDPEKCHIPNGEYTVNAQEYVQ